MRGGTAENPCASFLYRAGKQLAKSGTRDRAMSKQVMIVEDNELNKNLDFYAPVDGNLINLGKTDLSFSPGLIAGNILLFKPARNFQVSLLSKYVGKQYMSNLQSAISKNDVLESYFVNDINIIYELQPKRLFKSITLTVLVNNTFNVKYISNGYYYTYDDTWSNPPAIMTVDGAGYYPQATRNFLIGMTLKF